MVDSPLHSHYSNSTIGCLQDHVAIFNLQLYVFVYLCARNQLLMKEEEKSNQIFSSRK